MSICSEHLCSKYQNCRCVLIVEDVTKIGSCCFKVPVYCDCTVPVYCDCTVPVYRDFKVPVYCDCTVSAYCDCKVHV